MVNPIVQLTATQVVAPSSPNPQKRGAAISQGATNLAEGTTAFLTSASGLTAILNGALAITSITWTTNVATVTTAAPHGIPVADVVPVTIAGATPTTYNGAFQATSTGAATFTYPLLSNPGGATSVPGTWVLGDVSELVAMVGTFFAQGGNQGLYVLELGEGDAGTGVPLLATYVAANTANGIPPFYAYLVPREWDHDATFLAFLAAYSATTAKTYFFVTTTSAHYTDYASMKQVDWMIEAAGIPSTEFSHAADFYAVLNTNPSSTNKVAPFSQRYLFGVTPYPTVGASALLTSVQTAGGNVVGTGAQGGISANVLDWGTFADKRPINYWYAVDWTQFNVSLNLSAEVINGANNPINPLYFNQDGLNRLQAVAIGTMGSGVSYGMIFGTVAQSALSQDAFNAAFAAGAFAGQAVVNFVPFAAYAKANPSDYAAGRYAGVSIVMTPLRGFEQILVNLVVTDFVAA